VRRTKPAAAMPSIAFAFLSFNPSIRPFPAITKSRRRYRALRPSFRLPRYSGIDADTHNNPCWGESSLVGLGRKCALGASQKETFFSVKHRVGDSRRGQPCKGQKSKVRRGTLPLPDLCPYRRDHIRRPCSGPARLGLRTSCASDPATGQGMDAARSALLRVGASFR
jgi:hypothetical protein